MPTPRSDTAPPPAPALLPRQLEVVRLLAGGLTPREAAARLGIRPAAAWLHVFCARRRLGCETTDDLVAEAARLGLIPARPEVRVAMEQETGVGASEPHGAG